MQLWGSFVRTLDRRLAASLAQAAHPARSRTWLLAVVLALEASAIAASWRWLAEPSWTTSLVLPWVSAAPILLLLFLSGLRPRHLGLDGPARSPWLVLAALTALVAGGVALAFAHSMELLVPWREVAHLAVQSGSFSLAEEIIWRGFLLAQVAAVLARAWGSGPLTRWLALAITSVAFGVSHVPVALVEGAVVATVGQTAAGGLLFAFLYT